MTSLTGPQTGELVKFLCEVYRLEELMQLMYYRLDVKLENVVGVSGRPVPDVVADLIDCLERQGRTAEFLEAVLADRPTNPRVRDFCTPLLAVLPRPRGRADEGDARPHYLKAVREDLNARKRASLPHAVLELGVDAVAEATRLPWVHVDLVDEGQPFATVDEAFAHHERRLLILGEPGTGKSTSLLRLAEAALAAAEADPAAPVPLVVNLSGYRPRQRRRGFWGQEDESAAVAERDVERWLAEQMEGYPGVSEAQARRWLSDGRVAVFLDGLDEVSLEFREELVRLLNDTFLKDNPFLPVVVCSRVDEYRRLQDRPETRLHLRGGVTLRPLSFGQVTEYLKAAGAEALAERLFADDALGELARTPLTLSMMVLAYGGLPAASLPSGGTLSERRHALMAAFVERMLQRKERRDRGRPYVARGPDDVPVKEYRYPPAKIDRWLGWLAVQLSVRMRTTFHPTRCYPLLAEEPSSVKGQRPDWAVSAGKRLGWVLVGLLLSTVIALALGPWTQAGALAAAVTVLGSVLTPEIPVLLRSKRESLYGLFLPTAVTISCGLSLLGHVIGTHLSWGLSPYPAAMMVTAVFAGLMSVLLWLWRDSHREGQKAWLGFLLVAAALPVGLGAGLVFGWSWEDRVYWVAFLVLLLLGGALMARGFRYSFLSKQLASAALAVAMVVNGSALVLFFVGLIGPWFQLAVLFSASLAVNLLIKGWEVADDAMVAGIAAASALSLAVGTVGGALAGGVAGATLGAWGAWILCLLLIAVFTGNDRVWGSAVAIRLATALTSLVKWVPLEPAMRCVLAGCGRRPVRWRSLLGYAEGALLVKRAGRDREFAHRLLRDYFALLDLGPELAVPGLRAAAVARLGFQGEAAIEALRDYVHDPDPAVQEAAAEALGRIASPRVLPLLVVAMLTGSPAARRGVVRTLRYRDEEERQKLSGQLAAERDVSVMVAWFEGNWEVTRISSAKLLETFLANSDFGHDLVAAFLAAVSRAAIPPWGFSSRFGTAVTAHDRLASWLADPDADIRAGAVIVGSAARVMPAERLVERLGGDPDVRVRAAAARGLGMLYHPATRPALTRALADQAPAVRKAAAEALLYRPR